MTPFLDLVTQEASAASKDDLIREFFPKLASVSDDIEFDLIVWSIAQRLGTDSEELLRRIGERWLRGSELMRELEGGADSPVEALARLFGRLGGVEDIPLPGMDQFFMEQTLRDETKVKVRCEGARRCCSLLEGMARALCERFGATLRYVRQPKRATSVVISFDCVA